MRWKLHKPKLSTTDKVLAVTLGPYFAWPFVTLWGGPPPPKDIAEVILGIVGLYSTSKIVESRSGKGNDESPQPPTEPMARVDEHLGEGHPGPHP